MPNLARPNLARVPLAAVVCPSAPFLAPRLQRALPATSCSSSLSACQLSTSPQCANAATASSNAARGKKSGRSYFLEMRKRGQQHANRRAKAKDVPDEASPDMIELALDMQTALRETNLDAIVALYPAARDAGLVDSKTTYTLSQALHETIRRHVAKRDSAHLSKLMPFVAQLVADLQHGRVAPNTFAYVHLLGVYKDSRHFADGRALWHWLTQQDDAHCSQAAYGAAIELLSYGDMADPAHLQQLYEEGLARFPGTYADYHLSPDAIVPDRTQPVHIVGLPTVLFQGIITARLRSQDWKRAYLGLDTILRLYPGQTPHRIFELFITERPLDEAYTAYLLACRSGVPISGGQVTNLLTRLRAAMTQHPSQRHRFDLIRAMANAMYAFQQCGGMLKSVHVGQLIKAFEVMLPDKAPGQHFTPEEAPLRDMIATTAQTMVADLFHAGLPRTYHPIVALISLAGRLRAPDLLKQTLDDAKTAGITYYAIERRTLLAAAGLIQDRDLVKALWSLSVGSADKQGTQLSYNDWITFAKACKRAEYLEYFEQQLQEQAHSITSAVEKRVRSEVSNPDPGHAHSSLQLMTPEQLAAELQTLQAQMDNIRAALMSGQPLNSETSPFYMHINPKQPSLATSQDLRTVYDEFTTDPHQPAASSDAGAQSIAPALSTTGIPLDQLRFLNWVNIHEMMSFASARAESNQDAVSKAMTESLFAPKITPAKNADELRTRIKTLRNPDPRYTPSHIFRRIYGDVQPVTPDSHNTVEEPRITKSVVESEPTIKKFVVESEPIISKHVAKNFRLRKHDAAKEFTLRKHDARIPEDELIGTSGSHGTMEELRIKRCVVKNEPLVTKHAVKNGELIMKHATSLFRLRKHVTRSPEDQLEAMANPGTTDPEDQLETTANPATTDPEDQLEAMPNSGTTDPEDKLEAMANPATSRWVSKGFVATVNEDRDTAAKTTFESYTEDEPVSGEGGEAGRSRLE